MGSKPTSATYQLCGCGQVTSFDGASVSSSEKEAKFPFVRVLMGIQGGYACHLLSIFPDTQFTETVIIITIIILPPTCPAQEHPSPLCLPGPTPGYFLQAASPACLSAWPVGTAPVVQTAQAHEVNYMLPWQNSCLPILGCY